MYCTPQFFLLPHCCDRAPVVAFLNEGWMTSLGALQRGFHDSLPQLSTNKHLQLLTGLSNFFFTGRAPRFWNNKRFAKAFFTSLRLCEAWIIEVYTASGEKQNFHIMTFPTAYLPPSSGTLADTKRKRPRRFSRIISGMAPSAMKTTWVWETSLVSRDPGNRRAVAVHDSSHPFGRPKPRRVFSWLHWNLKNDKNVKKKENLCDMKVFILRMWRFKLKLEEWSAFWGDGTDGTWFRYYQILGCYLRSFVPYSISDIIINLGISDIPSWNQVQFKSASRAFWRCLILESSPHIKFPTVLPLDSRTMTSGLSLAANSTTSTAANYRKVKSKCEINGTRHTHRFVLWTSRWLTIAFFKRQVFSGVLDTLASRGLRPWVIEYTILYVDISTTWIGFLASSFKKPYRNDIILYIHMICIFPKKQFGPRWQFLVQHFQQVFQTRKTTAFGAFVWKELQQVAKLVVSTHLKNISHHTFAAKPPSPRTGVTISH